MKTFGVVREENKKSTRKKMPKIRHNLSPFFLHQPFHNLVRLFPGLFWGQPIDSGGEGGLAVFVNKINNLATQSWKKILAFAS